MQGVHQRGQEHYAVIVPINSLKHMRNTTWCLAHTYDAYTNTKPADWTL
jgi:hypothetical protein